jgi:hypothetical protein
MQTQQPAAPDPGTGPDRDRTGTWPEPVTAFVQALRPTGRGAGGLGEQAAVTPGP